MTTRTYFKSMEPEGNVLCLKTHHSGKREISQTLSGILKDQVILPNTRHGSLPDRLCASALDGSYSGSYRPEGVLFQTNQKLDYCCPVDLMALTNGDTFTSSDYSSIFIEGYNQLIFKSVDKMVKAYGHPDMALVILNSLRVSSGLHPLDKPFDYNEVCFENPVKMNSVGLVGTSEAILRSAEKYSLPVFTTTEAYVQTYLR